MKVHLRECQNSIYIPDEIIVVNDHGDPNLLDEIKKMELKTRVIYAWIKDDIKWNYTGARNLGFWLSRGDYISIEDDDHIPCKDYYQGALNIFNEDNDFGKVRTHKRYVVDEKDVLNKPVEEWKVLVSRPPHTDCAVYTRDTYLKLKGYDERFAGAYGWSATDWRRRLIRADIKDGHGGYQYVVQSPKTRGLSSRNYQYARRENDHQPPEGILKFRYEYQIIRDSK